MKYGNARHSIEGARLLLSLAQENGISTGACLRGTGLPEAAFQDAGSEIDTLQVLTIVRNVSHLLEDCKALGHELGRRHGVSNSGIWGYAILSSATVRSATELGIRYIDLTSALTKVKAKRGADDELIISFDDSAIPNDCRQIIVEWEITMTTTLLRDIARQPLPLLSLELRCDRPSYAADLAEFFGCPITFGCDDNLSIVDSACADMPLPLANEQTAMLCAEQCATMLEWRRTHNGVAEQVRHCLLQPGIQQSLGSVAEALSLSQRTLRRRLHGEGTSFRMLLDEVRFTLAKEMLQQDLTIEQVAERVGYAEPASFIHAFKRWTGGPPRAYRSRYRALNVTL